MNIRIDNEIKSLIPRLSDEEYELLEESIKKDGCRDALTVWNETLIDGHNRFEICSKLNIDFKINKLEFSNKDEVKIWIIKNQLGRRNIDKYTRGELALLLEPLLKEKAKINLSLGGKSSKPMPNLAKVNTRKEVSKTAKLSHGTIDKIKKIKEKANKETIEKVRDGKISIDKAFRDIKRIEKKKEFIERDIPMPNGKFNVIYCDPAWKYDFAETDNRAIENKYPTMTMEDMKNMTIPYEDNSVILMWATAPKIREALELMKSWGFEYKTNAIWDKITIGMGYWFRGQHELLLIGTKGKFSPPFEEDRFSSLYSEKKTQHSKKPEFYYGMIEKMFPKGRYLELFARNTRKNWTSWGNEVIGDSK